MSDEWVKWLIGIQADNFMGLNITLIWHGTFYRWYWRRPFTIERMELDAL
jgi:hypothetical protein